MAQTKKRCVYTMQVASVCKINRPSRSSLLIHLIKRLLVTHLESPKLNGALTLLVFSLHLLTTAVSKSGTSRRMKVWATIVAIWAVYTVWRGVMFHQMFCCLVAKISVYIVGDILRLKIKCLRPQVSLRAVDTEAGWPGLVKWDKFSNVT